MARRIVRIKKQLGNNGPALRQCVGNVIRKLKKMEMMSGREISGALLLVGQAAGAAGRGRQR